jgi:hypothetical protein
MTLGSPRIFKEWYVNASIIFLTRRSFNHDESLKEATRDEFT